MSKFIKAKVKIDHGPPGPLNFTEHCEKLLVKTKRKINNMDF